MSITPHLWSLFQLICYILKLQHAFFPSHIAQTDRVVFSLQISLRIDLQLKRVLLPFRPVIK